MPIDSCMISLSACSYFTFDDTWVQKPSVTLQFMALPRNWRFNSWFDRQVLCCKKSSHGDGSFEYPQHTFLCLAEEFAITASYLDV